MGGGQDAQGEVEGAGYVAQDGAEQATLAGLRYTGNVGWLGHGCQVGYNIGQRLPNVGRARILGIKRKCMSKFLDRLDRLARGPSTPMGFGAASRLRGCPRWVCWHRSRKSRQ